MKNRRIVWFLAVMVLLPGCAFFRANPLEEKLGAVVMVLDTRTAGDMKALRKMLAANDARATVFAAGRIQRGMACQLMDLRSEGHEFGLSGLKGIDPQAYSSMYGRQKYFQDEIVTQVLDAEREGLSPRYYLLRYPSKIKAETLALPSFLVSKGFLRVVAQMPDYVSPRPVEASELAKPVLHAYLLTEKNFSRAQIATLAKRNQVLVVMPNGKVLPDFLAAVRELGVPFATLADLKGVE